MFGADGPPPGGKKSLFDLLEDLDAAACLKKCVLATIGSFKVAFEQKNMFC